MRTSGKKLVVVIITTLLGTVALAQKPTALTGNTTVHGPESGSLIVIGGGGVTPEIWDRFIDLAGGESARIVVITNASGEQDDFHSGALNELKRRLGDDRVTQMHLKNIREANDQTLIAPLNEATGIFFTGGRQWRISEVYLNTLAHQAMWDLLSRGGVIAGSSAGASIQGSLLWRGDTSGPDILIGDHTQGLGFMKMTAIDQHILVRNRQHDLAAFIKAAPGFLGIGIDESTAIEVHGDEITVLGKSYVAIHHKDYENFRFLRTGQKIDVSALSNLGSSGPK
ncbi:MAG: cyanophycinase [Bacteroidales bacterium]|nr:cyanophycinase [Bacteroidales bacterium]